MADENVRAVGSTFPVLLPEDQALFLSDADFEKHVHALLAHKPRLDLEATGVEDPMSKMNADSGAGDDFTMVSDPSEASAKAGLDTEVDRSKATESSLSGFATGSKFMDALNAAGLATSGSGDSAADLSAENKMYTENQGIAYRSTKSSLLDLFSELEKTISGPRLKELLEAAWKEDSLVTLKIIWNARSIHLGKGEKDSFYRCLGWMRSEHPETVIANLPWTFRSVIEKKVKKEDEDDPVMVEKPKGESKDEHDVLYGVSHGYWKDLLNLLVLDVSRGLDVLEDPRSVLNKENVQEKKNKATVEPALGRHRHKVSRDRARNPKTAKGELKPNEKSHHQRLKEAAEYNGRQKKAAKEQKHGQEASRHANALRKFEDPFYRALHLTVARLFAEQLRTDMELLKSGKRKELNSISLAAKWAPSLERFHDKHTFIASSIAEVLYPKSKIGQKDDTREMYLKRAREAYRRLTLSPLRKALSVVERDITCGTFQNINYAKVPSIAMDDNKDLFARKDLDRFSAYIEKVAQGKSRISGAVLMPSTLVKQARTVWTPPHTGSTQKKPAGKHMLKEKLAYIQSQTIDAQWQALVQRIKDNGSLQSSIAVCDVSGSMLSPVFPDGTTPLDSAIGLSLLVAEITDPPFGGSFITFSADPTVQRVGGLADTRSLPDKIRFILSKSWSMNTDFVAVFERLILPMAKEHHLSQDDMVKQVFVFSDMQFDEAQPPRARSRDAAGAGPTRDGTEKWETAYERLKRDFEAAGYGLPQLVFWNLAAGDAMGGRKEANVAPKPVTKEMKGAVLVSGYSQGMMKMFLQEGGFGDEDEEEGGEDVDVDEVMAEADGEEGEGEGLVEVRAKARGQKRLDPLAAVKKAIGHKAYDMLRVVD